MAEVIAWALVAVNSVILGALIWSLLKESKPEPQPVAGGSFEFDHDEALLMLAAHRWVGTALAMAQEPGMEGGYVRSAFKHGEGRLGTLVASVPPAEIVAMSKDELRAHIIKCCRAVNGTPYRWAN